ncbi:10760_t:CDS:2 [Paraglomus brasilianum]|uniref:10760_t:CDS:1 n=1 Tax=Paraglomus brasilianum TaxID=144538 RepID=A0A9N9BH51_9GLOM|nr:10760_t:CDS:2 [Paraglomus brasilianum]
MPKFSPRACIFGISTLLLLYTLAVAVISFRGLNITTLHLTQPFLIGYSIAYAVASPLALWGIIGSLQNRPDLVSRYMRDHWFATVLLTIVDAIKVVFSFLRADNTISVCLQSTAGDDCNRKVQLSQLLGVIIFGVQELSLISLGILVVYSTRRMLREEKEKRNVNPYRDLEAPINRDGVESLATIEVLHRQYAAANSMPKPSNTSENDSSNISPSTKDNAREPKGTQIGADLEESRNLKRVQTRTFVPVRQPIMPQNSVAPSTVQRQESLRDFRQSQMPPSAYTRPYRQEYSEQVVQTNGRQAQYKYSLPPRPYQNRRIITQQQGNINIQQQGNINIQQQQYLPYDRYQQRQQYQPPQQAYNQAPQAPPRRPRLRPRSQTLPEPFYQFIESDVTAEPPSTFRPERQPYPGPIKDSKTQPYPDNRPLPIPPSGLVPQSFAFPPANSDTAPSGRLSQRFQPQLSPVVEANDPRRRQRRQMYPHQMRHSASLPDIRYVENMDAPPVPSLPVQYAAQAVSNGFLNPYEMANPYDEPSPTSSMFGHAESSEASSPRRARSKSWSSRGSGVELYQSYNSYANQIQSTNQEFIPPPVPQLTGYANRYQGRMLRRNDQEYG